MIHSAAPGLGSQLEEQVFRAGISYAPANSQLGALPCTSVQRWTSSSTVRWERVPERRSHL